jgi:DNA-binding MarR family transcriptional regulator
MSNLHVLSMLERHGEMSMSRVADALDVSVSNATGLVDRMEERGLVERVRVPDDRRVVLVHVTDAGRQVLADIEVFRDETIGRVIDQLSERQLARLAMTIGDLTEAVRRVTQAEPELFAHNHQFHESPPATADRAKEG